MQQANSSSLHYAPLAVFPSATPFNGQKQITSGYTCRVGDSDARCGPSSIQKFDGEDLAAAERSQAQHQQCYDWWEAQRAQHEALKAAQAEATLREQEAVR